MTLSFAGVTEGELLVLFAVSEAALGKMVKARCLAYADTSKPRSNS